MHVQVKSNVAPPEGMGGKVNGWVIHDTFRAKPLNTDESEWLYEPIALRESEALVMPLPEWLAMSDYRLFVHDTEIRQGQEAIVLCSTEGRPLVPYYLPAQQQQSIPNAFFSLPFEYVRVKFNGAIHHLVIQGIEPKQQEIENGIYATADITVLFEGPVHVISTFCRTCKVEFPLADLDAHAKHAILPSRFSVGGDLSYLDKAIRAAYKKSRAPKVNRVYYVASR